MNFDTITLCIDGKPAVTVEHEPETGALHERYEVRDVTRYGSPVKGIYVPSNGDTLSNALDHAANLITNMTAGASA